MKEIRILFVDDNSVNLMTAENLLLSLGLSIDKADSGESAILMATRDEYDLIFMDLLMPKMDGIMTTKLLRTKLNPSFGTKIIATSGIEMLENQNDNQEGLFDDRVKKPLKIEVLERCLEKWLGNERFIELQQAVEKETKGKYVEEWKDLIDILKNVKVINLDYLFSFRHKDIEYFIRLIKSSKKQINQAIWEIRNALVSRNDKIVHEYLHSLKSTLFYLGVHSLAATVEGLDNLLIGEKEKSRRTQKYIDNIEKYQELIEQLEILCNELEQALNAYNNNIKSYQKASSETTSTNEEIRKRMEQLLFHISRFEYIEILNGLNYLMMITSKHLQSFIYQAIAALEEFDYERVEALLIDCWKDINKS